MSSSFNMIEIPTINDVANQTVSFNAWQSRIYVGNTYTTKKNETINAYIEGDFHGNAGGGFRLRYAFVNFNNWTIGLANSAFTNLDVWVNISDFDGPPVGTWVRSPQIKYTLNLNESNQFNFSIEDPVSDYRTNTILDTVISSTKSYIPDVVSNYRHQFDGGNFQVSGVFRAISYKNGDQRQQTYGYGATFSGTFKTFKRDTFYYQALAGKGIERYLVGLGGYGLDAISFNNKLVALPVYGGYVGYTHIWSHIGSTLNMNSSFMYGYQKVDNKLYDDYADVFVGNYYSANLFFMPIERINMGFEFIYGDKKDYENNLGRNHRAYFTMEYYF